MIKGPAIGERMGGVALGQLAQARRLVHGVTDDRVLEPLDRPDVAGDDGAVADTDARRQLRHLLGQTRRDRPRPERTDGPGRRRPAGAEPGGPGRAAAGRSRFAIGASI